MHDLEASWTRAAQWLLQPVQSGAPQLQGPRSVSGALSVAERKRLAPAIYCCLPAAPQAEAAANKAVVNGINGPPPNRPAPHGRAVPAAPVHAHAVGGYGGGRGGGGKGVPGPTAQAFDVTHAA